MCDLTQFVFSAITTETQAEYLTTKFIENVVLSFGMVAIIDVDANSQFRSVFKDMCTALGIIYWSLVLGGHKGMSVEKCHHFLNKTQATAGHDKGTHAIFLQNVKTLSTPEIVPESRAKILSEVLLLSVENLVSS